jgi:hypothetical protein
MIAFGLLGLAVAGCSGSSGGDSLAPPRHKLDVYEAVFRYQLRKRPRDVSAYLSVDGGDAPAELLRRLRKDWPNLKPASEEPKEKGLQLYVKDLKWNGDVAVLRGGYWFPTKFAGQGYFADHRVVWKDGQWVVAGVTNETMS